jgi:hypothetical protein
LLDVKQDESLLLTLLLYVNQDTMCKERKLLMIYRYASQDDIDDVVLLPDVVGDAILSLSHDAAKECPSC